MNTHILRKIVAVVFAVNKLNGFVSEYTEILQRKKPNYQVMFQSKADSKQLSRLCTISVDVHYKLAF